MGAGRQRRWFDEQKAPVAAEELVPGYGHRTYSAVLPGLRQPGF